MSVPRDHHFLPVFYLKKWAGADGRLFEYSRPYQNKFAVKQVGPQSTGFQRDLYTFPNCPPEIAHHLERVFLMQTDHDAAKALQKHLTGDNEHWTNEERSAWSRFVINFRIRHPDPFAEIKVAVNFNWLQADEATQKQYELLRQPNHPATFEEWVRAQPNNMADRIILRLIQAVLDNEPAGLRLNRMLWNVLDVRASRFGLLTSDWPLFRETMGEMKLFMLPISPSSVFTAATHRHIFENVRRRTPEEVVRQMNEYVVSTARRFVYSNDNRQERYIYNRMSTAKESPPFYPSLVRR